MSLTLTKSKHKPLTVEELALARDKWLSGESLVRIAHFFGVTPSVIHYRLKKHYGSDVCSPVKNSLVRGLVRDGYGLDDVRDLPESNQFYSSNRRDKVYTSYQDTRGITIIDNMPSATPSEQEVELNIEYFVLLFTAVVAIIGAIIND
jgi:hypothetical protein